MLLANSVGQTYIHGSVGSVLGAFAVSLLGSIYTRLWNGYAYPAMVPGVLLLVPTGLTAVGGLAQNYASNNNDQFSSGLNTGLAMIQCKSFLLLVGEQRAYSLKKSEHWPDCWVMPSGCRMSFILDH